MRRTLGSMALLAALLACLAGLVSAQTMTTYYAATGTPSGTLSPTTLGVNQGHNVDAGYTAWLKRMGANGVRVFGLQGMSGALSTFVANTPAVWGSDLNGNVVGTQAAFNAALALLRSPNGRTPYAFTWPNPMRWTGFELQMNGSSAGATGSSIEQVVATLQANKIEPMMVFQLSCNQFRFSSLDPTTAAYWQERWELYKHQYMASQWSWSHAVRKMEFYNEPDTASCVTNATWLDFYTLQTQAINNAYADYNSDVAAGRLACPVAACPFNPVILASAHASATFYGVNKPGPTMYSSGVPGAVPTDYFPYLGAQCVIYEHLNFPPFLAQSSPTTQNMMAYSQHSYGKTGYMLRALGTTTVAGILGNRTLPVPAAYPTLPYILSEVASHTSSNFDGLASNYDNDFEAARLGAQLAFQALSGWDTYVFKFSAAESSTSSSNNPSCVPNSTTPATMCGVQKTGLHWGELNYGTYPIGDTTLAAEAAGLIFRSALGGKVVETLNGGVVGANVYAALTGSSKFPTYMTPAAGVFNDGERRIFMVANDGFNPTDSGNCGLSPCSSLVPYPMNITLNVAAWGLPVGTSLVHNVVAAGYSSEVYTWPLKVPVSGNVTVLVPPYSISTIVAPAVPQTETTLPALADTHVFAGANQLTNYGTTNGLTVSTSNTATHDSTAVTLVAFNLGGIPAANVLTAVLELTVLVAPASDMLMTIVGINTSDTASLAWSEGSIAWDTAAFAVTVPTAQITSPAGNFVRLDNGNMVAGHVTVPANTPAGTTRRVEVTEYVRSATAAGDLTFVLARRLRRGLIAGNTGGQIPADTLSGGASVVFSSRSGPSGPRLRVLSTGTGYSQNVLFGVSYKSGGVSGRRRLHQTGAADPVQSGTDTTTLPAISGAISSTFPEATVAPPNVAGYSMRAFMGVANITAAQFALAQQRALERAVASTCGISRSRVSLATVQPSPSGSGVVVPISVSSFNNSAPDLGLALAEACADRLEAFQGLRTPRTADSHLSREFARVGLPNASFTTLSLELSRLFSVVVAADAAAVNSTLEEWKSSVENSFASGTMAQSLSAQGLPGSVTRPGKFSADGCVQGGNAVGGSGGGAAAAAPAAVCGACRYQHRHVIAAAVVGSIGGVLLGAALFGCAWVATRPREEEQKQRAEDGRYAGAGGQIPITPILPPGEAAAAGKL